MAETSPKTAASGSMVVPGFHPKKRERVRPEINVTPLVDVVLVLLIIFMVVTPELEKGGRVTLPNVAHPDPEGNREEQGITVTVSQDGALFIDGQPIVRTEVLPKLQALHKEFPDKRLYLKGDDRRPYGEMRDLFRDLQKVGFAGVRLLVGTSAAATQAKKE